MRTTSPDWRHENHDGRDTWGARIDNETRLYVGNYTGTDNWCAQTWRNGNVVSSIETGLDTAKAKAEERLAMPIEEFNAIVAADLKTKLIEIERELLRLIPDARLLPGFHAGYETGVSDTKRKIKAALA